MVKCTINGREVEVQPGSTIIEAFRASQTEIAHYCWHPGLSIAGVCRLCMVSIEGNPRLQIACNTVVTEGMKITNQTEAVKDAVKWGLDFHLINHPLDCPICDQAGECGLQDQYMKYGRYDSEMAERKVKKHKVVDLGPRVVLDSERCILCSRCVRFCDEVTKTNELGIFNRGDHAEIGTFAGKPLENNYSLNTVDICPVGALTSRDFRFRQRVWFLKEKNSICTGCSTGCNIKVYYNKEGVFRVRPVHNEKVNGWWMCDEGRDLYKFANRESRQTDALVAHVGAKETMTSAEAIQRVRRDVVEKPTAKQALVLTGSFTVEEYEAFVGWFKATFASGRIYHWQQSAGHEGEFDGLLLRGDRNPNTAGLKEVIEKSGTSAAGIGTLGELKKDIEGGGDWTVWVAGPENRGLFSQLAADVQNFAAAKNVVWVGAAPPPKEVFEGTHTAVYVLPAQNYLEKSGTFVNHAGVRQKVAPVLTIVPGSVDLAHLAQLLQSGAPARHLRPNTGVGDEIGQGRIHNVYTQTRGVW